MTKPSEKKFTVLGVMCIRNNYYILALLLIRFTIS